MDLSIQNFIVAKIKNVMVKIKSNGFTLIELIIVIVILGIVASGSISLLLHGIKEYKAGKENISVDWQSSLAAERITRDLHEVLSVTSATKDQFVAKNIYGVEIDYKVNSKLNNGKKQLLYNSQVLADGVENIAFTYYDIGGKPINEITGDSIRTIRYVDISLKTIYGQEISTMVALWNVK